MVGGSASPKNRQKKLFLENYLTLKWHHPLPGMSFGNERHIHLEDLRPTSPGGDYHL